MTSSEQMQQEQNLSQAAEWHSDKNKSAKESLDAFELPQEPLYNMGPKRESMMTILWSRIHFCVSKHYKQMSCMRLACVSTSEPKTKNESARDLVSEK